MDASRLLVDRQRGGQRLFQVEAAIGVADQIGENLLPFRRARRRRGVAGGRRRCGFDRQRVRIGCRAALALQGKPASP